MVQWEIWLDETASEREIAAVAAVADSAGLACDVSANYARRSLGDLPWVLIVVVPLGIFVKNFAGSFGSRLGEHAADATATGASATRKWVTGLYAARRDRNGNVSLRDEVRGLEVLLPEDLPLQAYEALAEVDPDTAGGDSGQICWDPERGWVPPF
jgi:hypothetical protein